ncbi:MAG: endoribonuclease MazF [Spirochaetales bacterium]|nr:endoribonuclease MazF [Spirochaetales bacterium]
MVMPRYVPNRGDIIWLDFDPQAGHEQAGKRAAIVLTPKEYNGKTNLSIACPITSRTKGYPFEVRLAGKKINGVILSDQVKSLDWKVRKAQLIEQADTRTISEVQEKISLLIQ